MRAEPAEGDIAIGGATLAAEAAALGLIDEYRARVYPVLVGGGIPFCGVTGTYTTTSTRYTGKAAAWSIMARLQIGPGAAALRCSCVERGGATGYDGSGRREGSACWRPRPPASVPCGPRAGD